MNCGVDKKAATHAGQVAWGWTGSGPDFAFDAFIGFARTFSDLELN